MSFPIEALINQNTRIVLCIRLWLQTSWDTTALSYICFGENAWAIVIHITVVLIDPTGVGLGVTFYLNDAIISKETNCGVDAMSMSLM